MDTEDGVLQSAEDEDDGHIACPWELTPCLCSCHYAPNVACDLKECWQGVVIRKGRYGPTD